MSQRPRLAGDGRLRKPEKVALFWNDFLRGRLSGTTVDPFDWTEDRLLLAESFTRLDLDDRAVAKRWFTHHGVVDRAGFVGPPSEVPYHGLHDWLEDRDSGVVVDHRRDIEIEQLNIRWHLATLARLSEHRSDRAWDPEWGRLIVDGQEGDLVVGGPHAGSRLTLPTTIDVLRREFADDPERQRQAEEAERLRAETGDWAIVEVGEFLWYDSWERDGPGPDGPLPSEPEDKARILGTTWDLTVALERLLIVPYVNRAVERRFTVLFEPEDVGGERRPVLVPREERVWQSILAGERPSGSGTPWHGWTGSSRCSSRRPTAAAGRCHSPMSWSPPCVPIGRASGWSGWWQAPAGRTPGTSSPLPSARPSRRRASPGHSRWRWSGRDWRTSASTTCGTPPRRSCWRRASPWRTSRTCSGTAPSC